ncbi:hypothetical protein SM033_00218 [Vibrio phage vB_VpaM_sm033]|nr:hypothetical protein SM033_00218 [Vibrio phage vB_VpaM_sm033]
MKIELVQNDRVIQVVHGSDSIAFRYSVWTVLNQKNTTDDIFGPTNEFLATLSEDVQKRMFDQYKMADDVFCDGGPILTIRDQLSVITRTIISFINYDDLYKFCVDKGKFYQDPPNPPMQGKNPPEMTYSLQEMFDLRVLCVGVKLLTPILGTLVSITKEEIKTSQKERVAAEIVTCTGISDWAPYQRFNTYIGVYSHRRMSAIPMALRFGAARADLDRYLLGMSIVRRFAIARLRHDGDGSILAYVYTFLEDKIKQLSKDNWNDKFAGRGSSNDQEGVSYADNHRISEKVTSDYLVQAAEYIKDTAIWWEHLHLPAEVRAKAQANFNTISLERKEQFQIFPEIHNFLCSFLVIKTFDPRTLEDLRDKDALTIVVATCAAIYESIGHTDLSDLLLSRRKERDPGVMVVTTNNQVIKRLSHALEAELSRCYPKIQQSHINNKTNPGKVAIEAMVTVVNTYEWLDAPDLTGIRHSIASFIASIVPETMKTPK